MAKCKNCKNLVDHWCEKVLDSPDEGMERECRRFVQKTNGDRVRTMSDEELAEVVKLIVKYDRCLNKADCEECPIKNLCFLL